MYKITVNSRCLDLYLEKNLHILIFSSFILYIHQMLNLILFAEKRILELVNFKIL